MLELLIAFLFSIGWLTDKNAHTLEVTTIDDSTFGIVITDGIQQKGVVKYDRETNTFTLE